MILDVKNIQKIIWYVPLELNHSSYVYTSLIEFANKYDIRLIVSNKNIHKKGKLISMNNHLHSDDSWCPKVCFAMFQLKSKEKLLIAFDCSDSHYDFSIFAFENAQIIFKRSFIEDTIKLLPQKYQQKLQPMGLPFMVKPDKFKYKYKIRTLFFLFKNKQQIKFDRLIFSRLSYYLKNNVNHWNNFINTRRLIDFNNYVNEDGNNKIFYQKRLFPNEIDNDTKEIHKQRIEIIRMLKKEFSNHFIGGLKFDPPLTDNFADCISNINGDPHSFLSAIRTCGICIYTRGLTLSTGWTLPEFLSQKKCVVAEKSETVFPQALIHNVHLMYFNSYDELIEICKNLIKNSEERERIAQNGFDYYNNFINPNNFIESLFK